MIKKFSALTAVALAAVISIGSPLAASATTFDVAGQALDFSHGDNDGWNYVVDDFITYTNVVTIGSQQIDARLTVTDETNVDDMSAINDSTSGPLSTWILFARPAGSISYKIEFFLAGTNTPAILSNVKLGVQDIDELQYFQADHISESLLSTSPASVLTVQDSTSGVGVPVGQKRFQGEEGSLEQTDEEGWANVVFEDTSEINITVGQGDYTDGE